MNMIAKKENLKSIKELKEFYEAKMKKACAEGLEFVRVKIKNSNAIIYIELENNRKLKFVEFSYNNEAKKVVQKTYNLSREYEEVAYTYLQIKENFFSTLNFKCKIKSIYISFLKNKNFLENLEKN